MEIKQSKHATHLQIAKQQNGYIIAMGEYQISQKTFETWQEAERYIATKPYEILINQTQVMLEYEKKKSEKAVEKTA